MYLKVSSNATHVNAEALVWYIEALIVLHGRRKAQGHTCFQPAQESLSATAKPISTPICDTGLHKTWHVLRVKGV